MWLFWSNYFLFCLFKCRIATELTCCNYLISNLGNWWIVSAYSPRNVIFDGALCTNTYSLREACAIFCVSPTVNGSSEALTGLAWIVDVGSRPSDVVYQIEVWCAAEVVFATQCHYSGVLSLWLVNSATFPTFKAWGFEKSVPEWLPKLVRGTQCEADF